MKIKFEIPARVLNDHQAGIFFMNSPRPYKRSKHMELKYYHLKGELLKNDIKLEYINTSLNQVHGMTKALGGKLVQRNADIFFV